MSGAEQQSLEEKIIAAAMCVKGAALTKFVIGRRKRHERHVRVTGVGKSAMLKWGDNNSGRLLRAEESLTLGQRREQRRVRAVAVALAAVALAVLVQLRLGQPALHARAQAAQQHRGHVSAPPPAASARSVRQLSVGSLVARTGV